MIYVFLSFIGLSRFQIDIFFYDLCSILKTYNIVIKIIYKNNKVIKHIEVHDLNLTEIDLI